MAGNGFGVIGGFVGEGLARGAPDWECLGVGGARVAEVGGAERLPLDIEVIGGLRTSMAGSLGTNDADIVN